MAWRLRSRAARSSSTIWLAVVLGEDAHYLTEGMRVGSFDITGMRCPGQNRNTLRHSQP
jgi:hypothetical protein